MTQLFISDLHLDTSRPEAIAAFETLLENEACKAERLYILGDLFEGWIGDDEPGDVGLRVIKGLQKLHQSNTSCYFINGNRDFLIRNDFATAAGIHLLPDCALTDINGERVLMLHGDLLCTDDTRYLRFRKIVRSPLFQTLFLALPARMRQKIAGTARDKSQLENAEKQPAIMDVSQRAVAQIMELYGIRTMIHGHTHRPAIHQFKLGAESATRIVLGDWYEQGSMLRWNTNGYQLEQLTF